MKLRSGVPGYPHKGWRLWRFIVTSCHQGTGAPVFDHAWTNDVDGNKYTSVAVLLMPWRRNLYGEHARQRALVLGWRT